MTAVDEVAADEQLVEHLRTGDTPDPRNPLAVLLAAWRAFVDSAPLPALVDLDTAVAAVTGGDR